MKQRLVSDIESQMQKVLDNSQLEELHRVLCIVCTMLLLQMKFRLTKLKLTM